MNTHPSPAPAARRAVACRRAGTAAAVAVLVLAAGTACSSDTSDTSGPSADPAAGPSLTNALPKAAAGDIDHLDWGLPRGEPGSLDPLNAYDYSVDLVLSNLCDPLFRTNPDFTTSPNLATSTSRPDKLTVVYTIREGVKFWNGHPLTAEDVAYSLGRNLDPQAPSHFLFDKVKSIKATGTHQVTVRFKTYDELFTKELASPIGGIVEKAYAVKAGKNLGTAKGGLMCSGPFRLKQWNAGSGIELERNDAYWNPAYKAHARTATLKFLTDSTALAQALVSGEVDGAYEVPPAVIPRLKSSADGTLHFGPSIQYVNLALARSGGPLADSVIRKALFTSIDRAALAKVVFNGAGEANYTNLPTSGWDPEARDIYQDAYGAYEKSNAYDVDAAKKLVDSVGAPKQPVKLVTLAGDATQSQLAQLIQQQAKAIGLTVRIQALQPLQYGSTFVDPSARKDIDLLLSVGYNQVADPLEQLGLSFRPGATYNYTGYDDPSVNSALAKAQQSDDATERAKLIVAAQKVYEAENLTTSLVGLNEVSYLSNKLSGATTSFAYMFQPSLALIGPVK
ncbi:ABC transporter substrate-binding protein [Streptomyces europaeiscabiei]|nr:ABC transporter substrate-binding protein [Streptomyces europaeiscabiei]MDX3587140.1 ABC transporter substrate-binding protein [Streptomyces europaeiscabiei]MDX3636726.1 ABC transporter substrate-binding protein [Streptomyces europaeiscabiei]MDX3650301.1 ABC transporter substrate-binding protein [Streptomyces europaeiscabiei]WUD37873.1 ABC transporter substrate-binding protein [Streptomyces europaeiscabiei]